MVLGIDLGMTLSRIKNRGWAAVSRQEIQVSGSSSNEVERGRPMSRNARQYCEQHSPNQCHTVVLSPIRSWATLAR